MQLVRSSVRTKNVHSIEVSELETPKLPFRKKIKSKKTTLIFVFHHLLYYSKLIVLVPYKSR